MSIVPNINDDIVIIDRITHIPVEAGKITGQGCLSGKPSIGYIFQTFNLLQGFTVLENVLLGMSFGEGVDRDRAG